MTAPRGALFAAGPVGRRSTAVTDAVQACGRWPTARPGPRSRRRHRNGHDQPHGARFPLGNRRRVRVAVHVVAGTRCQTSMTSGAPRRARLIARRGDPADPPSDPSRMAVRAGTSSGDGATVRGTPVDDPRQPAARPPPAPTVGSSRHHVRRAPSRQRRRLASPRHHQSRSCWLAGRQDDAGMPGPRPGPPRRPRPPTQGRRVRSSRGRGPGARGPGGGAWAGPSRHRPPDHADRTGSAPPSELTNRTRSVWLGGGSAGEPGRSVPDDR